MFSSAGMYGGWGWRAIDGANPLILLERKGRRPSLLNIHLFLIYDVFDVYFWSQDGKSPSFRALTRTSLLFQ